MRRAPLPIAAVVAGLLLAGCGSGGGSTTQPAPTAAQTRATQTVQARLAAATARDPSFLAYADVDCSGRPGPQQCQFIGTFRPSPGAVLGVDCPATADPSASAGERLRALDTAGPDVLGRTAQQFCDARIAGIDRG